MLRQANEETNILSPRLTKIDNKKQYFNVMLIPTFFCLIFWLKTQNALNTHFNFHILSVFLLVQNSNLCGGEG